MNLAMDVCLGVGDPVSPGKNAWSVGNPGNPCGEIPVMGIDGSPDHGRVCEHVACPPDCGTIVGPPGCGRVKAPRVERTGSLCPPDSATGDARGFRLEAGRGRCGCYEGD